MLYWYDTLLVLNAFHKVTNQKPWHCMLLGWMWISDVVLIMCFFIHNKSQSKSFLFLLFAPMEFKSTSTVCSWNTYSVCSLWPFFPSHFSPAVLAFCHSWSPGLTDHKQTMKCSQKKKKCTILEMKTMRIIVLVFLSLQQFMLVCNVHWSWHRSIIYIESFRSESELKLQKKIQLRIWTENIVVSVQNLNWNSKIDFQLRIWTESSGFSSESELKHKYGFSVQNLNWKHYYKELLIYTFWMITSPKDIMKIALNVCETLCRTFPSPYFPPAVHLSSDQIWRITKKTTSKFHRIALCAPDSPMHHAQSQKTWCLKIIWWLGCHWGAGWRSCSGPETWYIYFLIGDSIPVDFETAVLEMQISGIIFFEKNTTWI